MYAILSLLGRHWAALRRPSPSANAQRLRERGEDAGTFLIRDARAADIPKLAALHVKTWNTTYAPFGMNGPPVSVRAAQWRDIFDRQDPHETIVVVERADGELVGFARGIRKEGDASELNKIYLLREYQRVGLGRKLLAGIARSLAAQGAARMSAYTDARNPSGWFFERLGGTHHREPGGRINREWYHWNDLPALVERCRPVN